ncbi:hypothetical protein GCM10010964_30940 [Caldovatus sediminis]|uniref:Glycosyltransferase n=1 Tax=Caldovatus sediminis TaxID=2041189 RepID=A0A8J2ZDE6_9PROT|nr:glycosyltransferase family 4 protein [Caldovatus sediminis]GGG41151.1 hypothetical protein GCM10010964_30940 [Caldovatus sediminis]
MRPIDAPLVFVTVELPRPGEAGHLAGNHAILSYLVARGHEVVLMLARPQMPWPLQRFGRALDPDHVRVEGPGLVGGRGWVATVAPRHAARILARRAIGILPGPARERVRRRARAGDYGVVDAVLGRFIDQRSVDWAAARIAALRPRAVLIDTIFRAPLLRAAALARIPSILIAHDVFHQRHQSLSARGLRLYPPSLTRDEELDLLRLADVVVTAQPEEAALLSGLLPTRRVLSAPMPVRPRPRPAGVAREPGLLAFVGSDSVHNVDGMRWFLAEVWPRIRAALPAARLEVCGTVGRALGAKVPEGVTLRGVVPDLGAVLHRSAAAVAPVLAGSGLKIKVLDCVSHGLPVVTTSVGAEGFVREPCRPLTVADGAEDFACAAVRLAGDAAGLAERERRALDYCRHYAPERVFAGLAEILDAL